MTLSEIYKWITDNFPYYRTAGNGWKVRDSTNPLSSGGSFHEFYELIVSSWLGMLPSETLS